MLDKLSKGWKYTKGVSAELKLRGQLSLNGRQLKPIDQAVKSIDVSSDDRIIVEVASTATKETAKSALIEIDFQDQGGMTVDSDWPIQSEKLGEYRYLEAAAPGEKALTQFVLDTPKDAVKLTLRGRTWNRYVRTMIEGDISVRVLTIDSLPSGESQAQVNFSAKHLKMTVDIPDAVSWAEIELSHRAQEADSSGPVTVKFRDQSGRELLGPGDLAQHSDHGAYFSLNGKVGEDSTTKVRLEVPPATKSLDLEGLDWGPKTALLLDVPTVAFEVDPADEIRDFLDKIPGGDRLYVIDTTAPPLGHETLSLRPNNLTPQYEKLGIWVVFLPFGTLQEYSSRPSEKVLQVPRKHFQQLSELLRQRRNAQDSVYICSSFPNFQSVAIGTQLKAAGWSIVYECRDDMEEFNRVGYSKWYSQELERYFLNLADKVVAVSPALLEKLEDMTPRKFVGRVIPNGVANRTLESSAELREPEMLEQRNQSRIVGYVGHLTASWFDWQALIHAALNLPDVEFQIVGHGMPENLAFPSNIKYLGSKTHEELLEIVPTWKVGLIPFQDMPLTRSVDPNKIYEYFAWGLRCVTSMMGSVHEYPSTWVYSGRDSFVEAIREAVFSPFLEDELGIIKEFALESSWLSRAHAMRDFIDERDLID